MSPTERLAATARHLAGGSAGAAPVISRTVVVGAGPMGAGIAQVIAQNGLKVMLCDIAEKPLEAGRKYISKGLKRFAENKYDDDAEVKQYVDKVLKNIEYTTDSSKAVADADLVIEAIIEKLDIKQSLFERLDKVAKPSCLFATNTSSLVVTDISTRVSPQRKKQFGGLHFFNPVAVMKLVEVVKTDETSQETIDAFIRFSKSIRKVPVTCKDTPGFIVNRLLTPFLRDALAMLERGDASAEDIDTAMKMGAGHPMGPLELQDLIGLDVGKAIGEIWLERYRRGELKGVPKELFEPSKLIDRLVSEGKLGIKTGEGIYKY